MAKCEDSSAVKDLSLEKRKDVMTQKNELDKVMGKIIEEMSLNKYTIVKRNGMIVPFRRERIELALELAFRDTKKLSRSLNLDPNLRQTIAHITDLVMEEAFKMASSGIVLTVEGIQDIVEVKLMETGHHDVAKDYIIYRNHHKKLREDSPRNLKILRRDNKTQARFNPIKIASSVEGCFHRTLNINGPNSEEIIDAVNRITTNVIDYVVASSQEGIVSVTMIQDAIERTLMAEGYYEVAKDYILYRSQQTKEREEKEEKEEAEEVLEEKIVPEEDVSFTVTTKQGTSSITKKELKKKIAFACKGLSLVSAKDLVEQTIANFYEGITEQEVSFAPIMAARANIEMEPSYTYVAANLLLDVLYRESMGVEATHPNLEQIHRNYFKSYLKKAVSLHRIDPALLSFDLETLSAAFDLKRDHKFTYLGLQTLYDRYFIQQEETRLETPQIFWMRVAMGLALNEKEQKEKRAIEFYHVLSRFLFTSGTPTLFNSGTTHSQLSSCYLSTVMDDLAHIYKVISDDAQLSKWAGGLGNDWTNVRATGAMIKGTNGKSQGVIPFLKVANDTAVAVNQCFAPDTNIYTSQGMKAISDVKVGDLVLGISGRYREVLDTFVYNQQGPMVTLSFKHALSPLSVTSGHPFYAVRNVPQKQPVKRTLEWLEKGKLKCEWIEAGELTKGDYVAQVIPKEVIAVADFDHDDARLYGILLCAGYLSKEGSEWEVVGTSRQNAHLDFVRSYLIARDIRFWETNQKDHSVRICWAADHCGLLNGTTGRIVGRGEQILPFGREDLYDTKGRKQIAPRLSHLPRSQTWALIRGLLETEGNVSRDKEVTFCNPSLPLSEGLRYQLLRMGIPSSGSFGKSKKTSFHQEELCYEVRIPAIAEVASLFGCEPLSKRNFFSHHDKIYTKVTRKEAIKPTSFVCDLKVEGDESYMTTTALAHNGGKRKGAMCAYLETWHLDMGDFLELRKNTGDERRRTHDMNTANWIPDLFMKRVINGEMWTLFSPEEVPDLHDLYGQAFEKRYVEYETKAEKGEIRLFKKIEAVQLWRKMLGMLYETGHPWITFKDPSNIRSPQDHAGVVHSSNLCTEILLNTSKDETAVCNLGSINLPAHMTQEGINRELLASTIRTAIRMLDNVIDINFYPTIEAANSNKKHRPIGLGIMGFQDALYMLGISYASHEAVEFSDESMELISYHAILASSELAKERGPYPSYKGSKWSRGILPMDSIEILAKERGEEYLEMDPSSKLDWQPVRDSIKKYGMRNSNTMAIAPTATIANITGVTPMIEPMYKHLFVKSNLSGEFTVVNTHLVDKLKELDIWDHEMLDDLKYFDGSLMEIERIPEEVKKLFLTAFEIEPEWLIECASRRQKWIDMGQSLNLYIAEPSGKKLNLMYLVAWKKGLKTTYYLRSLGATHVEKASTDINKRPIQPRWMKNESPSSRIKVEREEKPFVCNLEEGCESCQ